MDIQFCLKYLKYHKIGILSKTYNSTYINQNKNRYSFDLIWNISNFFCRRLVKNYQPKKKEEEDFE